MVLRRRWNALVAAVLLFEIIATAVSAEAACWASNPTGERTCRNFYSEHGPTAVRLCEDQPDDCLKLGYTLAARPTRHTTAHAHHRRVLDSDKPAKVAPEPGVEASSRATAEPQETPSGFGFFLFLGVATIVALPISVFVWWGNRSREIAVNLISHNAAKLAVARNEELYGLWSDTIPDEDELEKRRDAYPGQEPSLSRSFQIDFTELAELPESIKLNMDYSRPAVDGPTGQESWSERKMGFLLYELSPSLPGPKWLSLKIDGLSGVIDREADAYLARKHSEFHPVVFLNAIHAATSFQLACEMSRWFIRRHARNLAIRRSQLISKDIYGVVDSTKWQREKAYFFSKVNAARLRLRG